jgi:hypothetical protein
MAVKVKKVDVKAVAKNEVMTAVSDCLKALGYNVEEGTEFGMTKGTLVVGHATCDIQIKPIVPKAGVDRYDKVE